MPDIHHRLGLTTAGGIDALARGRSLCATIQTPSERPSIAILTGGRRGALGPALRRVQKWKGPVLVDCAAGLTPDAVHPLRHADRTLLVTTDDPQCVEDTARTQTIATRLGAVVAGVVVRETPGHSLQTVPSEWSVLARLPHVESPLDSTQLSDAYLEVSSQILPARADNTQHHQHRDERTTASNVSSKAEYLTGGKNNIPTNDEPVADRHRCPR
jgi:septum site-determining protein MinD